MYDMDNECIHNITCYDKYVSMLLSVACRAKFKSHYGFMRRVDVMIYERRKKNRITKRRRTAQRQRWRVQTHGRLGFAPEQNDISFGSHSHCFTLGCTAAIVRDKILLLLSHRSSSTRDHRRRR